MQDVKEHYDKDPYFSAAFADSSVARIQAIGEFLSLNPPSLNNARILELGCSYGGNILPFAIHFPNAEVIGIDISSTQVQEGNKIAKKIGLKNFKLIQKDILSLDQNDIASLGKFDYIISHGVYTWVKENVKNALLAITKNMLNLNGIAYISYNVYPGWSTFSILREYMLFVSQNKHDSNDPLLTAKDELKFMQDYLKTSLQAQQDPTLKDTSKLMLTQLNFLRNITKDKKNDYYILHEFLESVNKPVYFHKFAKKLDNYGLCYLLESTLEDVFKNSLGIYRFDMHIQKNYKTRIQKEQMRDFLLNRSFRKSLIMHKEKLNGQSDFDINITPNEIAKLYIAPKLTKTNDIFHINDIPLNSEFNDIYEVFYKAYPQSLSLNEFNSKQKQKAIMAIFELISNPNTALSTQKLQKITYEPGKTALNPLIKNYFEYFLSTDSPVILMANRLNQKVVMSKEQLSVAINFDGKNSLLELENFIPNEANINNKAEFIKQTHEILINNYFLEEI